ncbi:hypothetical protein FGO68_gene14558 [Halteria grandinella]|uniref:Ankyrin repeat domain-containing protein n=1 Tax=Halteria grandinella TaxID=5974 RepID=A0A8J8T0W5_HALGN|nr:hypothetical protein FGO68_gene14558 [Halteria grandinella]
MGWTPLLWAAAQSDAGMVQRLIDCGANVLKAKKQDGFNVLHICGMSGDARVLQIALRACEKRDVDIMCEEGYSAAHLACMRSNMDVLNLLIENGADLVKRNVSDSTCFDELLKQDDLDLLECIYPKYGHLQRRQMREPGQFPMIHIAAGAQGSKCLKYLIDKGEHVNQICNEHDKATPLHFAVLAQNIENVKLLLKNGANPNARDTIGNNSMHFAVMVENLPIVKLLDDFGCDASVKNDSEMCAIDVAQNEGNKDIMLHFMAQQKYKNFNFNNV